MSTQRFAMLEDLRPAHVLVEQYHYSKRAVRNSSYCGGAFIDAQLVGGCFFFSPAARWSVPVLELCRLVRVPGSDFPLSKLISFTVKHIKQQGIALLISYADATQDHHGGIYQACSWNYAGMRKPSVDGYFIDGVFTPRRSCNEAYGTSSYSGLKKLFNDVVPHRDLGKHLYWKALNKHGRCAAESAGLLALPYPKPAVLAEIMS